MKKVLIIIPSIIVVLIVAFLLVYPHIEIDTGSELIRFSYTDDLSEYEENASYNELYFYNEKHDVSIRTFNVKKFLFFYVIEMECIPGDFREVQFVLEESYIADFIENADIEEAPDGFDLAALIEGKEAVVGNTRYTGNDYEYGVFYELNGRYEEMYVFYADDLLVIQVGSPDELPKFIAYK